MFFSDLINKKYNNLNKIKKFKLFIIFIHSIHFELNLTMKIFSSWYKLPLNIILKHSRKMCYIFE
jgi:hypothetical protein